MLNWCDMIITPLMLAIAPLASSAVTRHGQAADELNEAARPLKYALGDADGARLREEVKLR